MNKKNIFLQSVGSIILVAVVFWLPCEARKFKIIDKSEPKTVSGPFLRAKNYEEPQQESQISCEKKVIKSPGIMPKPEVSFDWTHTTTQNLESAVDYFFSIIPEDQEELRSSLKQKELKTKDKIKKTKAVGDQNYREAEFLASKLSMVANWHKAAQENLMSVLQQKDDSIGGIKHKDFKRTQKNAQKELLYEIYAMLDGAFPDPLRPVDHARVDEKIHEVVTEVFIEFEQAKNEVFSTKKQQKKSVDDVKNPAIKPASNVAAVHSEQKVDEKKHEKENIEFEIKIAKFKDELEAAKKTLDKSRSDNLRLKEELDAERKKRAEENIRQKMEEKRFQDVKVRLEKEKNELESKVKAQLEKEKGELEAKISMLEKKKSAQEGKIQSLEDDVRKEATGKAISNVELEKVRKQKESTEAKLEKKRVQISELEGRLQENDRKQIELQIQLAKLEHARVREQKKTANKELLLEKKKKTASVHALATKVTAEPGSTDSVVVATEEPSAAKIENTAKKLEELNDVEVNQIKKSGIKELESLFSDFAK